MKALILNNPVISRKSVEGRKVRGRKIRTTEATDSVTLHAHIKADAPHGVKNMPDDAYTKYTIRRERSLFVELKDDSNYHTSSMSIEDKLWSFICASDDQTLSLKMAMLQSDSNRPIAECIFWYWNDKEISILQKRVHHPFGGRGVKSTSHLSMQSFEIFVPFNGATPANNKFNVVIRLLDERISCKGNSLQSYYGDYEGVETVTLSIAGIKEASFVVPKYALMFESRVFKRMFANEMTERSSGKLEIKDTNAEEFSDFLKAISPKQEQPNPSNVFALLKLADFYDCQSLRDRCELHLMNCIEIPLIHRLTCANFYRLDKLKNSLMMSLYGTGLSDLFEQTEPYLGIMKELARKRKHT